MNHRIFRVVLPAAVLLLTSVVSNRQVCAQSSGVLMDAMRSELRRALTGVATQKEGQQPPYYLSYSAHDQYSLNIMAQQGALITSESSRTRAADVVVRVGDAKL